MESENKHRKFYAQVTHSRIGRRISHGYDPTSFVAIRIGLKISVLHPLSNVVVLVHP